MPMNTNIKDDLYSPPRIEVIEYSTVDSQVLCSSPYSGEVYNYEDFTWE